MPSRNLQRRHAKAVHRKKALEERRRLEAAGANGSLAVKVRRATAAPLHGCFVQDSTFESGVGMVILSRKTGARSFIVGAFLVDAYCLGVKDAMFRQVDEGEFETLLDGIGKTARLAPVEPSYARKLLRDAAAYAQSLGLAPHADYAAVEPLFGDVSADACDVQFQFGHQGRPLYVPGPTESPTQIRRRLDLLRRRLGDDGFDFGSLEDQLDAVEEPDDGVIDVENDYDPDVAPDPAEWLALDEDERIRQVKDYHRRDGVSLPNENVHAIAHGIIENQIALGDELPVRRALDRLTADGLDRHEAIHAVASLLMEHINEALKEPRAKVFPVDAYSDAVERITAESWRRQWDEDEA